MSDPDRLGEIKAKRDALVLLDDDQTDWLVGEVERLRGIVGAPLGALWRQAEEQARAAWFGDRDCHAEVERLRGLLKRLEWSGDGMPPDFMPLCPACKGHKEHGHHSDCKLAAEIHES